MGGKVFSTNDVRPTDTENKPMITKAESGGGIH